MKTNLLPPSALVAIVFCTALSLIISGCSGSRGGMNAEDSARMVNSAFEKQANLTGGLEKLQQELIQIPTKEQLSAAPERDALGFYILERQNDGPFKFVVSPQPNSSTGEFASSNTMRVALVTYKKVDDAPYKLIDKNITIPGFRLDAEVVLVDHTIPAVVFRKTFRGPKPEPIGNDANYSSVKAGDKEIVGKKPIDQIQKFLSALPFKQ